MAVGGNDPVFLKDFAKECVAERRTERLLTPASIHTIDQVADHRETVVDLACKDVEAQYYSGDRHARQSVEVKFGDFLDYYRSAFQRENHWLASIADLEFYLCQCPIGVFTHDELSDKPVLPRMMELFKIPQIMDAESLTHANLWMAIRPSRTNMHYDAYRNILVVFHGRKVVKLYPPSQCHNLYPRPVYATTANHSEINFAKPDFKKHPNFANALSREYIVDAGDALYIPEGWWHQVDSNAFTIAVNFWFAGAREYLIRDSRMTAYYARLLIEDLVKQQSVDMLLKLRREAASRRHFDRARIVQLKTQVDMEDALLGAPSVDLIDIQGSLAQHHPIVWKSLLTDASIDFAAFLASFWDENSEHVDWLNAIFKALGDDADQIKHQLLVKQEAFKHKICKQVIQATLGCSFENSC